jgi:hypothetical protein
VKLSAISAAGTVLAICAYADASSAGYNMAPGARGGADIRLMVDLGSGGVSFPLETLFSIR